MADFFTFFDKQVEAANASPICKPFIEAGFAVSHTGGGCMALIKTVGDVEIMVTDTDSGLDFSDPDTLIFVGTYNPEEDDDGSNYKEFPQDELSAAVDIAAQYEQQIGA